MRLSRRSEPFDSPDWIYELKIDGFRAIAAVEDNGCRLISRNGHAFRGFDELRRNIAVSLKGRSAILDGEICCLDADGKSVFHELMFNRHNAQCYFFAFDALWIDGEDLRQLPLLIRKTRLRGLIWRSRAPLRYLDHIEFSGRALFEKVCAIDAEGIVAKRKDSKYRPTERPSKHWIKIKNPTYSQTEGREDMFDSLAGRS
jgi:bifunctional non-homologous end joining protein LigD